MTLCFYSHIIFLYVLIGFNLCAFDILGLPLKISLFALVAETPSRSQCRSLPSLSLTLTVDYSQLYSSPVPDSTCSQFPRSLFRYPQSLSLQYYERYSCLCGNTASAATGPLTLLFRLDLPRYAVRPTAALLQKSSHKQTVINTKSLYKISK